MSFFRAQFGDLEFHATMLALVVPAALAGLIAIWAAISKAHWFVRAAAVWATVAILLPIRAYEPALMLSVCLPFVSGIVILAYWLGQPRTTDQAVAPSIRFGLRDLFLLVLVFGLWLACWLQIVRSLHEFYARYFVLTCLAISATILLAYAPCAGGRRSIAWPTLAVAIGLFAAIITHNGRAGHMDIWYLIGARYQPTTNGNANDIGVISFALAELAVLVALGTRLLTASPTAESAAHARRPLARFKLAIGAAVLLTPLGWLYWQMFWLTPLPPPFRGGPTQFAQLANLAAEAKAMRLGNAGSRLQSLSELCDEAIVLLADSNYTPFESTLEMTPRSWDRLMTDGRSLRDLSQTIAAEAAAAEKAGNADRALGLMIAELRLGSMLARGGDLFIAMDGDTVSYYAQRRLIQRRDDLSREQIRAIVTALSRLADEREPLDLILARDAAYQQRIWGWLGRLQLILDRLLNDRHRDPRRCEFWWRVSIANELLKADLAVRLYRSDQGQPPASLADLVPDYLDRIPIDAYSSNPLCYHAADGKYTLHSIGWDRRDNGGRFGNLMTYVTEAGYDFDLDTPVRP